jgi:hypothetical protein
MKKKPARRLSADPPHPFTDTEIDALPTNLRKAFEAACYCVNSAELIRVCLSGTVIPPLETGCDPNLLCHLDGRSAANRADQGPVLGVLRVVLDDLRSHEVAIADVAEEILGTRSSRGPYTLPRHPFDIEHGAALVIRDRVVRATAHGAALLVRALPH